jgi:hypothetical protein
MAFIDVLVMRGYEVPSLYSSTILLRLIGRPRMGPGMDLDNGGELG